MRRRLPAVRPIKPVRATPPGPAARAYPRIETVAVGGLPVARLDRAQTASMLISLATRYRRLDRPWIATSVNGQVLSAAALSASLRESMLFADLISCDGQPLVTASAAVAGAALPERVATTDLFHDVAALARTEPVTMYFLGASEAENAKAVTNVRFAYPHLRIVGSAHGYRTHAGWIRLVREIDRLGPDLLWLALGVPREQEFYMRFAHAMPHVGLIKTSGGLFNFLSTSALRAPQWMQDKGLEWVYRMGKEPRRLMFRYLTTSPHAALLMLTRRDRTLTTRALGSDLDET
jgi:N-acetylglucosaminyldiphosphoundecaprenol N-acetyl-beta-D-mannosaminyltransferase